MWLILRLAIFCQKYMDIFIYGFLVWVLKVWGNCYGTGPRAVLKFAND